MHVSTLIICVRRTLLVTIYDLAGNDLLPDLVGTAAQLFIVSRVLLIGSILFSNGVLQMRWILVAKEGEFFTVKIKRLQRHKVCGCCFVVTAPIFYSVIHSRIN